MSDRVHSHRLSDEAADLIVRLTTAGAELLRVEDAYHVAVLTNHHDSPEVVATAEARTTARETYRRLLATAARVFHDVTH